MLLRLPAVLVAAAFVGVACSADIGAVSAPPLVTSSTTVAPAATTDATETATTSTAATAAAPAPVAAEIRQVDCPASIATADLACGVATVALDRLNPDSATTEVTIATMRGYDAGFDTPVAVLQGGPGGASSQLAGWFPQQAFPQVFIDQRGTGFLGPDFNCLEFDGALGEIFESRAEQAGELASDALDACAGRLADNRVLHQTTTQSHAADVVAVMEGLGYQRWVVYGVSYGTTIGFELLRTAPPTMVGAVLDGVYPPDIDVDAELAVSSTRSLNALASACSANAGCANYTDDVVATVDTLIARLDEDPMVMRLSARESGLLEPVDLVLDGTRLAEFTFLLLYSESRLRFLPAILAAIEQGDESAARWLAGVGARTTVSSYAANNEATYFAVQCNDRLPFANGAPPPLAPFAAAIASVPLSESCASWHQPGAYDIAGAPVVSDIPTLLLSGEFDPITPPTLAVAAAAGLSHSTLVAQDGRGHGIWFGNGCIASIVQDFVADPARTLDTACAAQGVGLDWTRP